MSLSNVSVGMGIVNTTTSAHIQRALTRSAINSDIGHSASSSALPREHGSSEVDLEVDAGPIHVPFREPDSSIFSANLLPALGDASTGQILKQGLLCQEQQVSAWSPLTGMSILGDADYSLDTSDWLLENEVFDLFDFPNLETGTLDDEPVNNNSPHIRDLRGVWYVPVANDEIDTGPNLNVQSLRQPSSIRDDIDEAYRADMETVLVPAIRSDPLPSIDLLVSSIHHTPRIITVSSFCRMFASVCSLRESIQCFLSSTDQRFVQRRTTLCWYSPSARPAHCRWILAMR